MDEDACELVFGASLVEPDVFELGFEGGGEGAEGREFGGDALFFIGKGRCEGGCYFGEELAVFGKEEGGSGKVLFVGCMLRSGRRSH